MGNAKGKTEDTKPSPDLGRLRRIKGMVESARTDVGQEWHAAPALTESYNRLRGEVLSALENTPHENEFENAFQEIEEVKAQRASPRSTAMGASAAARASGLLGQMAAWLKELIDAEENARDEWAERGS